MSFTRQTQVRAALIRLGGLLLLLFLLNSLLGLAAIRYTKQAALQDLAILEQIEQAQAQAQSALVHFKIQVQEWKNILLRGDEAENLHALLETLAIAFESGYPSDLDLVLQLSGDRSALMERIRADLLGRETALSLAEKQQLLEATSLVERITWLVRRYLKLAQRG